MDEGIGVDAFDCHSNPQSAVFTDAKHAGRFQRQKGTKAFSACQSGIAHGFIQAAFRTFHARQHALELFLNLTGTFIQNFFEI